MIEKQDQLWGTDTPIVRHYFYSASLIMRGFKSYIDDGKVPQQNVEKARKIQTNMGDEFSVLVEKEPLNRVLFFLILEDLDIQKYV